MDPEELRSFVHEIRERLLREGVVTRNNVSLMLAGDEYKVSVDGAVIFTGDFAQAFRVWFAKLGNGR